MLIDDGHDVTVIDDRPTALAELGKSFNGATVVGNASSVDVLGKAGAKDADIFVATTDNDNVNLMSAEVAKVVFGVPRTVARLYDPKREGSYRALDIQFITGTTLLAQVMFEHILEDEFHTHVPFSEGDVEVVEFRLGPGTTDITVGELEVRDRLRIAAVRRGDITHIPSDRFRLDPGDLVVAAARDGVRDRIARYLADEIGD